MSLRPNGNGGHSVFPSLKLRGFAYCRGSAPASSSCRQFTGDARAELAQTRRFQFDSTKEISMGILSWLGGGRTDEPVAAAGKKAAGGAEISYDAGLIERLKRDHEGLVERYAEISGAIHSRRYQDIPRLLGMFKIALQAHIMTENVKFYVYLQNKVARDPETAEYVADLRREMDGIARAVVKFANTHASSAPTEETAGAFIQQLNEIGDVLLQRVRLEESRLYTLYTA